MIVILVLALFHQSLVGIGGSIKCVIALPVFVLAAGENAAGDEEWKVTAPPLCDLCELPSQYDVNEQIMAADEHIAYLQKRAALDLVYRVWWNARIEEAKTNRQPWVELQLAQQKNSGDGYRRRRLVDLRDLIGPGAYLLRQIPPSVSNQHKELFQ